LIFKRFERDKDLFNFDKITINIINSIWDIQLSSKNKSDVKISHTDLRFFANDENGTLLDRF